MSSPTPADLRARLAELVKLERVEGEYGDPFYKRPDGLLIHDFEWTPDLDIAQIFMCVEAMRARGYVDSHRRTSDSPHALTEWTLERAGSWWSEEGDTDAEAASLAIYRALEAEESETCP